MILKSLLVFVFALLSMNSAFAQELDDIRNSPLYCTSDDVSLVVWGNPGDKTVNVMYAGLVNGFAPDEELAVNVVSKVFNRLKPENRVFSIIAATPMESKTNYFLMVTSSGPIQLKVSKLGVRAKFNANVSGSIPQDEQGRSFANVPVECELKPVLFK